MNSGDSKPLRSPFVEALRTLFFASFFAVSSGFLILSLWTGRTMFPARWNDIYVTASGDTGWFIASMIGWLLICWLFAWLTYRCGKRFVLSRRRNPRAPTRLCPVWVESGHYWSPTFSPPPFVPHLGYAMARETLLKSLKRLATPARFERAASRLGI